ncbi:MAG TPA: exodeoxyribonuclease VII large subunit [Caldilineaceae bacterium]|nr:exodeoxyribonuclease VII large subunit [Caldilineaceae bacterium]
MVQPITISTLSSHIAQILERDELLRDLWVTGEVSNWKRAASGHIYFSMKDGGATIGAVMWRNSAVGHSWLPDNGDQIIAHGYVGLYPERGSYQLYVNRIQPAGRGQLYARFEALKAALADQGLFAQERKRPLVSVPQRIGIITSADAAALRDILRVLAARWPLVDVLLFPTLVQGVDAPRQIVQALAAAHHYSTTTAALDTIILARGGGSIEDLWAFNDEAVAYAVAQSAIPVIAGVGHETDFTIVDFVADFRAPTPSAAAAAAVPDRTEISDQLRQRQRLLLEEAFRQIDVAQQHISQLQARLRRIAPQRQLDQRRQRLTDRTERLHNDYRYHLHNFRQQLTSATARLQVLNPHSILQRGYSIVERTTGEIVTDPSATTVGEDLIVRSAGGPYSVTRR